LIALAPEHQSSYLTRHRPEPAESYIFGSVVPDDILFVI